MTLVPTSRAGLPAIILALAALSMGCAGGPSGLDGAVADLSTAPRCNGAARLCGRTYDRVAYPTTHNAMSSEERFWLPPNQKYAVPRQLRDGVRALMLDLHMDHGEVFLCHSKCASGKQRLVDGLKEIRAFMEAHPREVITLILESYVTAERVKTAMEAAGLMAMLHTQQRGKPWPTLERMIQSGRRLVVLTDHGGGVYPWLLAMWDFCWETNWSVRHKKDFNCNKRRGSAQNSLFILNHFITFLVALPSSARQVNYNPFFIQRALACQKRYKHIPNFVTVDFYSMGDLMSVVRQLNGLQH